MSRAMRTFRHVSWSLPLLLATGCADSSTPVAPDGGFTLTASGKADGTASFFIVSASSVEALAGDLSSLEPACETADGFNTCASYLSSASALGQLGPVGAYGPLGLLGPLGDDSWSASAWMAAIGDWSDWAADNLDGPLGEDGPLGPAGPLSDEAYWETLPAINDWSRQLQGGGLFTVLGPIGPLGALGPLGPLGPVGAHGYAVDANGSYLNGRKIVRSVKTSFGETFDLFEIYTEKYARGRTHDTSFGVRGDSDDGKVDSFRVKSAPRQLVTILVVPEAQLDDFDLTLTTPRGDVLATSDSIAYIDWIQVQAPAGGTFDVRVNLAGSAHFLAKRYRLYVVGSGARLAETELAGDHQIWR